MSHCVSEVQEKSFYVLEMIDSTSHINVSKVADTSFTSFIIEKCMSHAVSEVQEASLTLFK